MMTIDEKRNEILKFHELFIEGYILGDLEILNSIKPDPITGLKGCTIPMAMTIISSIDLLGFLLNEKGKTGKSRDNIEYFCKFKTFSQWIMIKTL